MNKYSKIICAFIVIILIVCSIIVIKMNAKGVRNGMVHVEGYDYSDVNYTSTDENLKEIASDVLYFMPIVSLVLLIISFVKFKKSKEEQKEKEKGGTFLYLILFLLTIIFLKFLIPFMLLVS